MKFKFLTRRATLLTFVCSFSTPAGAATITFIGGNTTWTDNATTASWNPADEPDADDDVIFNLANTVTLGSSNSILSLAMSNGISLATADFDLSINGLLQLTGAGTDLTIGGSASAVSADSITINSSAGIILDGGALNMAEESGAGLLNINAGGILTGQGILNLNDAGLAAATSLLTNSGTISASTVGIVVGSPPAGTLSINAADTTNARLDLDAFAPVTSVVNVFRNQTLDINMTLADAYSGDLNLFQNSSFDISAPWSIDAGAAIDIDNGFVSNGGFFDIPASTSFISGGAFTQTGGNITVIDADGTLQFNSPFTQSGGNLVNNGKVVFNANSNVALGANFTMPTGTSSLTVNAGVEVNVDQANFNVDGTDQNTNVVTIGSGAILDLDLGAGADEAIGATIDLNGGELDVTTFDDDWSINGKVNLGAGTGISQINGEALTFTGVPVVVGDGSVLDVNAVHTWGSGASLSIGSGATAELGNATFNSPGTISGAGQLRCIFNSTVAGSTTIGVNQFDWDGTSTVSTHTIDPGVVLTINSPVFDGDGDMDDAVNLGGNSAQLIVNGPASWTMNHTFTANTSALGTTTIGGTSRMIINGPGGLLNANGNTAITAPLTFADVQTSTVGTVATVVSGATLTLSGNTRYDGGAITGAGTFNPPTGANNTVNSVVVPGVTKTTNITVSDFNFDRGNWTLNPNSQLNVLVGDYDSDSSVDAFDTTISIEGATLKVNSDDPEFVMDGVMNMSGPGFGTAGIYFAAEYSADSDPLAIGNDSGVRDADLNVGGVDLSVIATAVAFNSDADVNVASPATLLLSGAATFNSVNGANSAEFTGNGKLQMAGNVTFNEATTLNMPGGSIGLDEGGATARLVNVFGPVVINTGVLEDFGASPFSGNNTIHVEKVSGIVNGSLTVNLDSAAAEWTLQSTGRLDLITDGTGSPTLLSGSPVNLNGIVNVSGPVETAARVDIGGTVNINTGNPGIPFFLAGGNNTTTPNTIVGGTINGAGFLGSQGARALVGFGTINCPVNFGVVAPSTVKSDLLADNGQLILNNASLNARTLGTADIDGILNVVPAWNDSGIDQVRLNGGLLKGGTFTTANVSGLRGHGLVSARTVNNGSITADIAGEKLIIQNAANDNDWDGSADSGTLQALSGGTLEIRDNSFASVDAFNGTVIAIAGDVSGVPVASSVITTGAALTFETDSNLNLTGSIFRNDSPDVTNIRGRLKAFAGAPSTIVSQTGGLDIEAPSITTLDGDLRLVSASGNWIFTGATFSGNGKLVTPAGSRTIADIGANINVLVENSGVFDLGFASVGRIDAKDFQQTATGTLRLDIAGPSLSQFDRLVVGGAAQLSGELNLSLVAFTPVLGQTFNIISASAGVSGTFASFTAQPSGMPPGLKFQLSYLPTLVQLSVVAATPFDTWISAFASITNPADRARSANPDGDSLNNLGEFALDGNPASGASSNKIVGKIASVSGVIAMTLTIPVRAGAVPDPADPAGGELVLKQTADTLFYHIQASDNFLTYPLVVTEVTGPDATAIQSGLPALSIGWIYRTFRSPGGLAGDPAEFMRAVITD